MDGRGKSDFTVYLEGHEGHQGNVLAHAFLAKVQRLILVLNKLERAFIESGTRQTDFEIVDADKVNPTTLSLRAVPKTTAYNPRPALAWGMKQIDAVARGEVPDRRVRSEIAFDLVKLATKEQEYGYKAFWVNGHAEEVRFDDNFLSNALSIARERVREEAPNRWHVGVSSGSVVGELKRVDDLDADNEFVIVPPVGAERVRCTFPEEMREKMGSYLFKVVRVSGLLYYGEESPFPYKVDARTLEEMPQRKKSFRDLRGIFNGREPASPEWGSLLNG